MQVLPPKEHNMRIVTEASPIAISLPTSSKPQECDSKHKFTAIANTLIILRESLGASML